MTVPTINQNELDGALGVLPATAGELLAVIGTSTAGPTNAPATFARVPALVAAFGRGPMVEAAAHRIEAYGQPVLVVRSGQTTDGAATAVTFTGTGTSTVTADTVTTEPDDDYEALFRVTLGGTIGTGPISFKYSLDGGRTMSATISLGMANTYTIPNSGVTVDFAAGTLVTGDSWTFRTSAPLWNSTELGTALDALGASAATWGGVHVTGNLTASDVTAIDTKLLGMAAAGKNHWFIGSARIPNLAESEATYLSSLSSSFSSIVTRHGAVCAGACEVVSSVSGRRYTRPVSFVAAPREASLRASQNSAALRTGALPAKIKDANGNPLHHDEALNPGLDDARFYTLRSHEGYAGVYVNRPRMMSPEGSDFQLLPHRRVMNIARATSRARMLFWLNEELAIDPATGFLLESQAKEIEADVLGALNSALRSQPVLASSVSYVLSRTDNVLSTRTMNTQLRIVPLAYAETITEEISFTNPALRVR